MSTSDSHSLPITTQCAGHMTQTDQSNSHSKIMKKAVALFHQEMLELARSEFTVKEFSELPDQCKDDKSIVAEQIRNLNKPEVSTLTEKLDGSVKHTPHTNTTSSVKHTPHSNNTSTPSEHTNTKGTSYKCNVCEYASSRKGDLTRHVAAVHDKIKPYKCTVCEYAASTKGSLTYHIQINHTKDTPHKCNQCKYGTAQKVNLKRHISAVHYKRKTKQA